MSKKINTDQIANELRGSSSFFAEKEQSQPKKELVTSESDITTSQNDVTTSEHNEADSTGTEGRSLTTDHSLDMEKLETVIKSLSEIPTSAYTTPVRLSEQEKKDIEDFIYITLRENGLQGNVVSMSKLLRYCMRYLMKIHEEELVEALKRALKKDTSLPI